MAKVTTFDRIEEMMKLMESYAVDEIIFDGITLKKSLHKNPAIGAIVPTQAAGPELSAEDQQDIELFGSPVVKRG